VSLPLNCIFFSNTVKMTESTRPAQKGIYQPHHPNAKKS
jgi:hypothetical protein